MSDQTLPPLTQDPQEDRFAFAQRVGWFDDVANRASMRLGQDEGPGGFFGGVQGQAASVLKGVADSFLGLGRAGMWLLDKGNPVISRYAKAYGVDLAEVIPGDLRDAVPDRAGEWIESRLAKAPSRVAGEIVGQVSTLALGGAPMVGAKVLVAPGIAISKLGAPATMIGAKILEKAPAMLRLSRVGQAIPQIIGAGTGFGIYNYMSAEGGTEERTAAGLHGLVAGAALHVLGSAANAAERSILSWATGRGAKRAANVLKDDIYAHARGARKTTELLARMDARIVGSAIEATGFAGLDKNWWNDVIDGVGGDEDAMGRAMEVWAGSFLGVMVARTGRGDIMSTYRREAPEMNTLEPRLMAESIRTAKEPLRLEYKQEQEPQGEPSMEAAARLPALDKATRPLFHSGWELKPGTETAEGRTAVTMEFPGAGSLRMWENEGATGPAVEGFGLEVPAQVFRQVRGEVEMPEGTENIRMVGKVADEFIRDLATVSMLRRIRGEILFGANGEAWAGGPWRHPDGRWHTIGLDGKHYSQGPFPEDGFKPEPDAPMPAVDNRNIENPQIARWMELMQQLRMHAAPNPGMDLIEASLALATRGHQNSISTQEVMKLLSAEWQPGMLNADLASNFLRPDNIEQFGLTVAQVAAGHLTAEQAAVQIGTVLAGPSKGEQLPAPDGVEVDAEMGVPAETEPAKRSPVDIAGERDWSAASGEERRTAAREYVAVRPDVKPRELQSTFLIPRETARDILGETRINPESGIALTEMVKAPIEALVKTAEAVGETYLKLTRPQMRSLAVKGGAVGTELASKFRETVSRKRALLGRSGVYAKTAIKAAHAINLHDQLETVKAHGDKTYQTRRYISLIDQKGARPSDEEAVFAAESGKALLTMQHTAAGAGGFTVENGKYVPMQKAGKATMPRQYTSDHLELIDEPAYRASWYKKLEELNPSVKAAALEADYKNKKEGGVVDVESPEHVAAMERKRKIMHVPAVHEWKGKTVDVLEPDPAVALHRVLERQAGRTAAIQVFGPVLPKKVMEERGITKPGITGALKEFARKLADQAGTRDKDAVVKLARDIASRIQGVEPNPPAKWARIAQEVLTIPRVLGAYTAGLYDIPAFITEPQIYVGWRNFGRALLDLAMLKRGDSLPFGSVAHELGSIEMGVSDGVIRKVGEVMSLPSNWLEKWKTVWYDRNAAKWIEMMRKDPRGEDYRVLVKDLHFTPEQAQSLVDGSAPQVLYNQARREMVVKLTNRGRLEERSEAAASPTFTALVRYSGYATMRMDQIATELANVAKDAVNPNATFAERGYAIKRAVSRSVGLTFAGAISTMLAMIWADLAKGRNGYDRFKRDLVYYPFDTLMGGVMGQIAAGPYGSTFRAMAEGDPAALVRPIEGLNIVKAGIDAFTRGSTGLDVFGRFLADAGVIPREARSFALMLHSSAAGIKPFVDAHAVAQEYDRLEKNTRGFGKLNKQPEFYAAMSEIHEKVAAYKGDNILDAIPDLQGTIDKALGLQTGETAAAKLRSMRFLEGRTQSDRAKLLKFAGKEKFDLMVHHDSTLSALAEHIGRDDGTIPSDWGQSIEDARTLAQTKAPNVWNDLVERTVREHAQYLETGAPQVSDIHTLAMHMADYPESAAGTTSFPDWARESLADHGTQSRADLTELIAGILLRRSMDRQRTQTRAKIRREMKDK